eukprot:CAMPEP_0206216802 /NCGR_PEP_ID=MMETSP0047_2-20121206/2919_1 /ASSEMBLY_ACC=CAM_ASM_000192 /TAXON_ID=195065 /ORGANISM="Chroomonas mesostigmatica_cf, Strain CCMP1168" /LENGTH=67 /DNA_ID=CAMNT_0053639181 /DNA_START=18 /DNA_END=221 /DNA_ORIENTATION=+
MPFENAKIKAYEAQAMQRAAQRSMQWHEQASMARAPTCSSGGMFGCGGHDFSSSYGKIHEGRPVVFM